MGKCCKFAAWKHTSVDCTSYGDVSDTPQPAMQRYSTSVDVKHFEIFNQIAASAASIAALRPPNAKKDHENLLFQYTDPQFSSQAGGQPTG